MDADNTTLCREALRNADGAARLRLLAQLAEAWRAGRVILPETRRLVNLHCHTVYSYNGYGHTPSSLACLAREQGWYALASVDFDVLDAVDETLAAADLVGVRAAAGIETRVVVTEFLEHEMNSPGEPGIAYHVGMGFTSSEPPAEATAAFAAMRARAADRNREMTRRINAYLEPVTIDYDRDVLPLTPAGNATERHILVAYDAAARRRYSEREALVGFWAGKLKMAESEVDAFLSDTPFPHDAIRARLMKRGAVGYVQPGPQSFPPLPEVSRAIVACGALPVTAWLDGSSSGEQRLEELLDLHEAHGAVGLCIIPERNWSFADPAVRTAKVEALQQVVAAARERDLAIIIGTEMNRVGQPLIDDLENEHLRFMADDALAGADLLYGHTLLQRAVGQGYQSDWAARHLPRRSERHRFYAAVGRVVPPGGDAPARVAPLTPNKGPDALLAALEAEWGQATPRAG